VRHDRLDALGLGFPLSKPLSASLEEVDLHPRIKCPGMWPFHRLKLATQENRRNQEAFGLLQVCFGEGVLLARGSEVSHVSCTSLFVTLPTHGQSRDHLLTTFIAFFTPELFSEEKLGRVPKCYRPVPGVRAPCNFAASHCTPALHQSVKSTPVKVSYQPPAAQVALWP
jgi:hypothetical protein